MMIINLDDIRLNKIEQTRKIKRALIALRKLSKDVVPIMDLPESAALLDEMTRYNAALLDRIKNEE